MTVAATARRILLADHELGMRDLFHYSFEPMGYEVVTVSDGAGAVAEARSRHFDLIVLDDHIAVPAGADVLVAIAAIWPRQRFLVLTSDPDAMPGFEAAIRRRGIRWLFKPVTLEELTEAITAVLGEPPAAPP